MSYPAPAVSTTSDPTYDKACRDILRSALGYAFITVDEDARITSWSEGARHLMGWTEEEMIGSTLERIFTPQDRADGEVERELRAALGHQSLRIDRWHLRKDGSRFWTQGHILPLREASGHTCGVLKIVCDHSAEHQRLLDLQFTAQTKDAFIATLAHELRNPLAPVASGLEVIRHALQDPRRIERTVSMIERQVGQLARLVDDLLDVSRVATGKLDLKLAPIDLRQVLALAEEMSRPHVEAAHHALVVNAGDAPIELMGDSARLAQVFANLLNNSARYTPAGGHINVNVAQWPGEVAVRVSDDGQGIEPHLIGQVFGMYRQLPLREPRRGPVASSGLGIGLALVQGIVRLHGGRVEVHSAGAGMGSEFTVILPRLVTPAGTQPAQHQPDDFPAAAADAPEAPHPRILVVDDNIDAASTVADLLTLAGAQVEMAHRGAEAVESTARIQPDIVLLDIGLPDISGYEVARRIRQLPEVRQPQIIALTGWGQLQDKEMAIKAGFDQHWTKPVDPQRLLELAGSPG